MNDAESLEFVRLFMQHGLCVWSDDEAPADLRWGADKIGTLMDATRATYSDTPLKAVKAYLARSEVGALE